MRSAVRSARISGTAAPLQRQFNRKLSIYEVQSVLVSYVLR
jgi:hypothetical protein